MKNIVLDSSKKFAFELCKKTLLEFDCKIIESNLKLGKITAKKSGDIFFLWS